MDYYVQVADVVGYNASILLVRRILGVPHMPFLTSSHIRHELRLNLESIEYKESPHKKPCSTIQSRSPFQRKMGKLLGQVPR